MLPSWTTGSKYRSVQFDQRQKIDYCTGSPAVRWSFCVITVIACSAGVLLVRANVVSSRSFLRPATFDLQSKRGGEGRGLGSAKRHLPEEAVEKQTVRQFFFSQKINCLDKISSVVNYELILAELGISERKSLSIATNNCTQGFTRHNFVNANRHTMVQRCGCFFINGKKWLHQNVIC